MSGLRVDNLSVTLSGRAVLRDVSFAVAPGELVGILGPNGAGKTSLLRAIAGLVGSSGTIAFVGCDLADFAPRERARNVAYLPQDREVAWSLDVESVVALGRLPHQGPFEGMSGQDEAAVQRAMRDTDVAHLAQRMVTELSGGERSRVLLARALAQETPVLLADEPAAGLDLAHQLTLIETLQAKCAAGGVVLTSLHELDLATRCTRLLLLRAGNLVADGRPDEVLTPERLAEVYGVRAEVEMHGAGLRIRILGRI